MTNYTRQTGTTWQGVGTNVSNKDNIADVLKKANLDYEVTKVPMFTADGVKVPNYKATVKEGSQEYIGVVSNNYQIVQNSEIFSFYDELESVNIVRAGETSSGMVYMIGEMPTIDIIGDQFTPYICARTSHNRKYPTSITLTPLRIVCQNQFPMIFSNEENNFTTSIKHSLLAPSKIERAKQVMIASESYMKEFAEFAEGYAAKKISDAEVERLISKLIPLEEGKSEAYREAVMEKRLSLKACIDGTDDNQNFRGTIWGILNGYADYMTHHPFKDTITAKEKQFTTITFTPYMNNILSLVNEMVIA